MGNKPCRIALTVDQLHYKAGSDVTGKVLLVASSAEDLRQIQGLHLLLEGHEQVKVPREPGGYGGNPPSTVPQQHPHCPCDNHPASSDAITPANHHHHHHHHHQRTHSRGGCHSHAAAPSTVEGAIHPLVQVDVCLVKLNGKLKAGQYEYPFRWKLPENLPSTMPRVLRGTAWADIQYTISAYVAGLPPSEGSIVRATRPLVMEAQAVPTRLARPIAVDAEAFPITSCCFWNKGVINLGWQANTDVACPGSSVVVTVDGRNHSRVDVEDLTVQCVEIVNFQTPSSARCTVTRTLAQVRVPVPLRSSWQAHRTPPSSQAEPLAANLRTDPIVLQWEVPADARDSYAGRLIQVRHALVVTARTRGNCATSPESSCDFRVVRSFAYDGRSHVPLPPFETVPPMVEGELLPEDWQPVMADVIVLSDAAVIPLDNDHGLGPDTDRFEQWPTAPPEEPPQPRRSDGGAIDSHATPSVQQLQALVSDQPENLPALLEDPAWQSMVKNLSPRDYCYIVQQAGHGGPMVARTLAITMESAMTCRHLLACLYTLQDAPLRLDVIRQTARFLSDRATQQSLVEAELWPAELAAFQSALNE